MKVRHQIVRRFQKEPESRVLIISSVGSTGLNLSVANIVIFLVRDKIGNEVRVVDPRFLQDQPWSALEQHQIENRCHRQPQDRPVFCYFLLIKGTADIVLARCAAGKKDLSSSFLPSVETGPAEDPIGHILCGQSGEIDVNAEANPDDLQLDDGTKKTKGKPKQAPAGKLLPHFVFVLLIFLSIFLYC